MDTHHQISASRNTDGPQPVTLDQFKNGVVSGADPLTAELHVLAVGKDPVLDTPPHAVPGLEHNNTEPPVPQVASSHEARQASPNDGAVQHVSSL